MPEPCTVTVIYDHGVQFMCPQPKVLDIAVDRISGPGHLGSGPDIIVSLVVTHLPPILKATETTTDYQLSCELHR